MTIFSRYVLRQLAGGMVMVTLGLTCIIWLIQSLRYVDLIVNRGATMGMFMYFIMLLLPNVLTIILPIAMFAVVVFSYSRLIMDRELVVMRAAGSSQLALAAPALVMAGLVVAIGYLLNLYLMPASYRTFREVQWDMRYGWSHVMLREGTFNAVTRNLTIYVRGRTTTGELLGILIYGSLDDKEPQTLMAEKGAVVTSEGRSRIILYNGNRQQVDPRSNQLSILYFDKLSFDIPEETHDGMVRYREPRERTLDELLEIEKDSYVPPTDYGKYTVEAHKRLTSPISVLGYTLIGLAALLAGGFNRRSQAVPMTIGVTVVVVLQGMTLGLENVCAKRLDLIPLMYVNVLVPIAVAGLVLVLGPVRRRRASDAPAAAAK